MLCLDSVRYDTYVKAETPNMDAVNKPRRVYSFACWTIPSIFGYLMGFPPIGTGRYDFIPGSKKYSWAPEYLTKRAYSTVLLSTSAMMAKLNSITEGFFRKYWKHFINPVEKGTPALITTLERIVVIDPQQPHFVFMLLMDTHHPYQWGDGARELIPAEPQKNFDGQVKSIEYIDSLFPRIIRSLSNMGRPTRVIITSDHGELFGPHFASHDPSSPTFTIDFSSQLFEIPLVEGIVTP